MRKLASIRKIDKIEPIEGADKIVKATVGGWQLVTAIDNGFKEGDLVVYLEIDSWVPTEIAPFLSKGKEPRVYKGVRGERLRTVKLRGQISQGLLLPMSVLNVEQDGVVYESLADEGCDVTDELGIQKWEPEIPACLAGTMRGNFPTFIPKTDQERIQNLGDSLEQWSDPSVFTWEVTEKLEGSSMTVYQMDDYFGVCSRNMDLLKDETNTFWMVAVRDGFERMLKTYPGNVAVQGELIGPGIQGNIYGLTQPEFYVFDIYDIDKGEYMLPEQRRYYASAMGFKHTPVMESAKSLQGMTMQDILKYAEGDSVMIPIGPKNREREGVVFKANDFTTSFKAISNVYLAGEK